MVQSLFDDGMAQVHGENILQIMHCWNYGKKPLVMMLMWLNNTSYFILLVGQKNGIVGYKSGY